MSPTSFYPVLMTGDVPTTAAFYRDAFGFETTFEADWYVSLRLGTFELAILDHAHATIPPGYGAPARGLLLNLEVEDVDALHDRLVARQQLQPVLPLRDEDFGQRHFLLEGPDGVLIDVIQPIEPTEEFAAAYADSRS